MDKTRPEAIPETAGPPPITEADLHAFVDHQLAPERLAEVVQYLAARPAERERVRDWQQQNEQLRGLLDPVLGEPLPLRLPLKPPDFAWPWRGMAAACLLALGSAGGAWFARGEIDAEATRKAFASLANDQALSGFARRAAVAHAVYSPEVRRPVEVGADQEQALATWLTKRIGAPVHAPTLAALGYELIGGRLLPGDKGPVAQFMYGAAGGLRLTLYVTREAAGHDTAFRFGHDGPVNVFYWVDEHFGYAISAGADRDALMKVSQEVYRQLTSKTS